MGSLTPSKQTWQWPITMVGSACGVPSTIVFLKSISLTYSPVRSSSGQPTCSSHPLLSSGHGRWSSRCQAVGRWTCQYLARSSSLRWSPRHQTLVFHSLHVASGGLHRRRFWGCKAMSRSRRVQARVDQVGQAYPALQGGLWGRVVQEVPGFLWTPVCFCGLGSLEAEGGWRSALPVGG